MRDLRHQTPCSSPLHSNRVQRRSFCPDLLARRSGIPDWSTLASTFRAVLSKTPIPWRCFYFPAAFESARCRCRWLRYHWHLIRRLHKGLSKGHQKQMSGSISPRTAARHPEGDNTAALNMPGAGCILVRVCSFDCRHSCLVRRLFSEVHGDERSSRRRIPARSFCSNPMINEPQRQHHEQRRSSRPRALAHPSISHTSPHFLF